jgi:hypothetical protein
VEHPLSIQAALDAIGDARGKPTVAAFLLLAGIWHKRWVIERLVPRSQLEALGLTRWKRKASAGRGRLEPPPWLCVGVQF